MSHLKYIIFLPFCFHFIKSKIDTAVRILHSSFHWLIICDFSQRKCKQLHENNNFICNIMCETRKKQVMKTLNNLSLLCYHIKWTRGRDDILYPVLVFQDCIYCMFWISCFWHPSSISLFSCSSIIGGVKSSYKNRCSTVEHCYFHQGRIKKICSLHNPHSDWNPSKLSYWHFSCAVNACIELHVRKRSTFKSCL